MDFKELLEKLNPSQKEAVNAQDTHLSVVAGPGTGKTRVLTARILFFLAKGVDPGQILAITFTNKAASEIRARLKAWGVKDLPVLGTFHSWAYNTISKISGQKPFVVDEAEQLSLLREARESAGIKGDSKALFERFLLLKQFPNPDIDSETEPLKELWQQYHALLKKYNVWDFDELLHEANRLIKDSPDMLPTHLLVDEFQDVNPIQYEMVRGIGKAALVTVIGDPKQAIYGFRGASPAFLDDFEKDFSPLKKVTLEIAYRCPQRILDAASALFPGSARLISKKEEDSRIVHKIFDTDAKEASWIAKQIDRMGGGLSFESFNFNSAEDFEERSLSHICILFRARVVAGAITDALTRQGIPFHYPIAQRESGSKFVSRLNHLLGLLSGRALEYHLSRLGIDSSTADELTACLAGVIRGKESSGVFLDLFKDGFDLELTSDDEEAVKSYLASLGQGIPPSVLYSNEQDQLDFETEAVTLMTLHGSKGLEFPVVFLVGVDKEVLPWKEADEDEERRLFYVGLTRSAERLYITSSRKRTIFGKRHNLGPSPFLRPLEPFISTEKVKRPVRKRPLKKKQKSLF